MNRDSLRSRLFLMQEGQVRTYLLSTDWQETAAIGQLGSVWHRPEHEESDAELLLPNRAVAKDYLDRLADLLEALAAFERRAVDDLLQALEFFAVDLIAVRVKYHDVEDGTIPLEDGVLLNQRARDLMTSAALSVISKRRHFLGSHPPEATDYLARLRLGQTRIGSYVVSVLAPVSDASSVQSTIDLATFTEAVTSNLTNAMQALTGAIAGYSQSRDLSAFDLAVEKGASANMCDALAGFSGKARARSFSVSIQPAKRRAMVPSESFAFEFSERDVKALGEAADYFRDSYVLRGRTIRGVVKRLDRSPEAETGAVTITAPLLGGVEKNIQVQLSGDDYIEAIHAHEAKAPVECQGDVHVSPRSAKLLNPNGFKVFRNGQLFDDA